MDLVESQSTKVKTSDESDEFVTPECHIQKLPLELITKIVKQLSTIDILTLTKVSKIWRCNYLNQNVIWKNICQELNISDEDYSDCPVTTARSSYDCRAYFDLRSEMFFGSYCKWWSVYCRYNMIVMNIKNNDFPTFYFRRYDVDQSFCNDGYIINIYRLSDNPIEILVLKGSDVPKRNVFLEPFDLFATLLKNVTNVLNIVGNRRFLVFEICSVIFVYSNENGNFVTKFQKTIISSVDYNLVDADSPGEEFVEENVNAKMDICNDKLALIHPYEHKVLVIDLINGEITNEFEYKTMENARYVVDCIKCADNRLMIGLTITNKVTIKTECVGIVYQLDKVPNDNQLLVPVMGIITQFKVTKKYIGIQNNGSAIPIVKEDAGKMIVFWIECNTFSFDCTRNYIYYNVNQSIFQYDLSKSTTDKYEVTQKIAVDMISDMSNLTPINDRFLLVRSVLLNAYSIFDVIDHVIVRSIQLDSDFTLIHVGKLYIVFSNSKEYLIVSFV